jgi:hypothetical protein
MLFVGLATTQSKAAVCANGNICVVLTDEFGGAISGDADVLVDIITEGGNGNYFSPPNSVWPNVCDGTTGLCGDGDNTADGTVTLMSTSLSGSIFEAGTNDYSVEIESTSGYVKYPLTMFDYTTGAGNTVTTGLKYTIKVVVKDQFGNAIAADGVTPHSVTIANSTSCNGTYVDGQASDQDSLITPTNDGVIFIKCPIDGSDTLDLTVSAAGFVDYTFTGANVSNNAQNVFNSLNQYSLRVASGSIQDELGNTITPANSANVISWFTGSTTPSTTTVKKALVSSNHVYIAATGNANLTLGYPGYLESILAVTPNTTAQQDIAYTAGNALEFQIVVDSTVADAYEDILGTDLTVDDDETFYVCPSGQTTFSGCVGAAVAATIKFNADNKAYIAPAVAVAAYKVAVSKPGYAGVIDTEGVTTNWTTAVNPDFNVAGVGLLDAFGYHLVVKVYNELSVAIAGATVSHNGTPCTVVGGVDSNFYYCTTNTAGPIAVSAAGYMDLKVTLDTALASVGVSSGNMTEIILDAATACTGGDPAGTSVTCSGLKYPIKVVVEDELGNPINGIATNQITLGGSSAGFVTGNALLYNTGGVLGGTVPGYRQNSTVASGALTVDAGTAGTGQTVLNLTGGATTCAGGTVAAGGTLECAGLGFPLVVDAVQNELGNALTLEASDFVAVYDTAADCTNEAAQVSEVYRELNGGKWYIAVANNASYWVKYGKITAGYVNTCDSASIAVNSAGAVVKPSYVGATDGLDYSVKVQLLNENDTALEAALDTGRLTLTVGGVSAAAVSGNYAYYPVAAASGNAVVGGYKGYINVDTGTDSSLADVQVDESAGQTLVNLTEQLVACGGANVAAGATANCRGLLYQIKAISGSGEVITDAANEVTYAVGDTFTVCQGTSAPADAFACTTEAPVKTEFSGTTRYIAPNRDGGNTYVMLYKSGYVKTISAVAAPATAGPQVSLAYNGANAVKHSVKVVILTELGEVPGDVYAAGSYTLTIATQTSTQRVANTSYFAVPTAGAMSLGFNNGTVGFLNVLTTATNDTQLASVQAGVNTQTVVNLTGQTTCADGSGIIPAGETVTCRGLRYPVRVKGGTGFLENEIPTVLTLDGTETIEVCLTDAACSGGTQVPAALGGTLGWHDNAGVKSYYLIPATLSNKYIRVKKSGYIRTSDSAAINFSGLGIAQLSPAYVAAADRLKYKLKIRVSDELGTALTDTAHMTLLVGGTPYSEYLTNYFYYGIEANGPHTATGGYNGFINADSATDTDLANINLSDTAVTTINMTAALLSPCIGDALAAGGGTATCQRLKFQIRVNSGLGNLNNELGAAMTNIVTGDTFKVCTNTAPVAAEDTWTCTEEAPIRSTFNGSSRYIAPATTGTKYISFTRGAGGYVETIDVDGVTADPAGTQQTPLFNTAWAFGTRGDSVRYALRVTVSDELGNTLNTPWTIQHNLSNPTTSSGNNLYWATTATGALSGGKVGYVNLKTADDTQLASVAPGSATQTVVVLSGGTPCAGGGSVAAGEDVVCDGLKFYIRVNVSDELANAISGLVGTDLRVAANNGTVSAAYPNSIFYTATTGALSLNNALLGYKNIDTSVDTQLADVRGGITGQTIVNLTGTAPCSAGTWVPIGDEVTCNGLDFQIKMLSGAGNLENEIGGTFTLAQGDIDNSRIEVCNVADCATSDTATMYLSGGSVYIAPAAAAGNKYIKYALPGYMETIAPAITTTTAAGAPVSPVFSGASGLPFALKLAGADVENELGGAVALVGTGSLSLYPTAGDCTAGTSALVPIAGPTFNGGNWYVAVADGLGYVAKYGQSGYITTCDAGTVDVDTTLTGAQAAPDFTLAGTDGLEFSVKLVQGDLLNELGDPITLAGGDTFKLFSNPDCSGEAVYISGPTFSAISGDNTWYAAVADGDYTPQYTQSGYLRTCDSAPVTVDIAGGSAGIAFTESLPFTVKFDETVVEDQLGNALASLDMGGTLKLFTSLVNCQAGAPEAGYVVAPSNPDGNWYAAVANGTYFVKLAEPGYIATCDTTGIVVNNTSATPFAPQWAMADGDGLMLPVKVVVEDIFGNTITGIPAGAITVDGVSAVADSGLTNELYYAVSGAGLLEGGVAGYMEVHTVSGAAITVTPGTDADGQTVISLTNGAATCVGGLIAAGDTATCAGISFPMVVDTGAAAVQNELGNSLAPLLGTDTLTVHAVADCATGANPVGTATFNGGKWYVRGLTDAQTYSARYSRAGYVPTCDDGGKTIDVSGVAVNPDFTLAGSDGVKFQLKVVVNDELGNPINDTAVRHGATVAPFSSGNAYYFNTTVAGDVSSTRAGYITSNTGRDTSLSNVPVATTQQRVITFDGATYCTVDNTTNYTIACAGQKFYLKVVANDRWGNALTGLTVAHNGVPPAYADEGVDGNEYYFNVNGTSGALTAGALTGYTDLNTAGGEDTQAASINYSDSMQTVVTLNGETRCTSFTIIGGQNFIACRGLYPEADYVEATEDVVTGEIIATEGKVINIDVYDINAAPFMVSTDQSVTINISLTGGSAVPASNMAILTGVGETNCDSVTVNSATDVDCTISTLGASKAASAYVTVSVPIVGDGTDVDVVVAGVPALANNGDVDAGLTALDVVPGPLDNFLFNCAVTESNDVAFANACTLTARDANNNAIPNFDASADNVTITGDATLTGTISGLDAGAVINTAFDGSGVWDLQGSLTYTGVSGTGVLTATSGTGKTGTANVTINPGALDNFLFNCAVTESNDVAFANACVLTARDISNNAIPNFNAAANNVTITTVAPLTGVISGLDAGNVINTAFDGSGQKTLTGAIKYTGATGTALFTATSATAKTGTASVTINAGALDNFLFNCAVTESNDVAFANACVLTARDVSNNAIPNFNAAANNVTITTVAPLTGVISGLDAGNVINTAFDGSGQKTLTGAIKYTGVIGTALFTATSATSKTGTASVTINPGALDNFLFNCAVTETNDVAFANACVLTARDVSNNAIPNFNAAANNVTITTVAPLTGAITGLDAGNVINTAFDGSGQKSLTGAIKYTGANGTALFTATSATAKTGTASVTIDPGALATLAITGAPATTYAGIAFTNPITITAYDAQGNVKTNYVGEIEFSSDDPLASLPANYTYLPADNGAKQYLGADFILRTTPQAIITATDTGTGIFIDTAGIIVVNPGTLGSIEITGAPASITAGEEFSGDITVTAYDLIGNVKTDYIGTVTFTSTDANAELPADYTFIPGDAGVRVFAAADFKLFAASLTATITATDAFETISGSTGNIVVTADADQLNPVNLASVVAVDFPGTTTYKNDLTQIVLEYPTTDQIDILKMLVADGVATYPVTIHIFDMWGNPIPSVQVYLIRIDGGAGRVVARVAGDVSGFDVPAVTDENGEAVFNLVSDEGGEFEFVVRYQAADGDIIGPNSFRISFQIADTHAPVLTITEKGSISVSLVDNDIYEIGEDITINFSVSDDPSDTSGINISSIKLYVGADMLVNCANVDCEQGNARLAKRSGNQVVPGASSCEFNPATMEGVCVWDTAGVPAAGIYNLTLEVADNHGNPVMRTFAIRMVAADSFVFDEVYVMPNPMTLPGAGSHFTFQSSRSGGVVTIEVYTSTGRLVWVKTEQTNAGYNQILWNGRSINGDYVPAGVYFYRIIGSIGGSNVEGKGKIAVIK